MLLKAVIIGMGLVVAPNAFAAPLHLVCLGNGSANRVTSTYGQAWSSNGNSAWGQTLANREVPFDDQVTLELSDDGKGRIRMPRAMLPPIRGGKDGWFEVRDIKM